jgi:hypothetical protein
LGGIKGKEEERKKEGEGGREERRIKNSGGGVGRRGQNGKIGDSMSLQKQFVRFYMHFSGVRVIVFN